MAAFIFLIGIEKLRFIKFVVINNLCNGYFYPFQFFVFFLVLLPLTYIIFISRHKNIIVPTVLFILFLLGAFALSFRKLRDVMPDPAVNAETSIGYAQYFGYPLYLDSIIFFILIISPVLFFTFIKLIQKSKPPVKKIK